MGLLFAIWEVPIGSLGFSPFELIFCHEVRGPLEVLKEQWLGNDQTMSELKERLRKCWEMARDNFKESQGRMKTWYDRKARERQFQKGDKLLVLLPFQGQPLQGKYSGPYEVLK